MNMPYILILICLVWLLFLYVRTAQKLWRIICSPEKRISVGMEILYIVSVTLPTLAMCAVKMPLPVFYLLFYGGSGLSVIVIQEKDSRRWLFANVRFLIFTAPHLAVIGALALCAQTNAVSVLDDFTLRTLSLIIVTLLNVTALSVPMHFLDQHHLDSLHWDSEEFQMFSRFVWFCSCSIAFDSILCIFKLPTIYSLLFLIGSNILLLLMAFLFGHHVYTIMRDSYLQEESLRLQKKAALQRHHTDQLEQEAYLDVLTQIYTRQYAMTNISNMLRNGESFALAFIDLDKLKQINDQCGHLAGDEYLKTFSSHMKKQLRPKDIFARYGGDEFLILMPDLSFNEANELLIRIQSDASGSHPSGWGTPFSYGLVAAKPNDGISTEEWISMADRAMYMNKTHRRKQKKGGQS